MKRKYKWILIALIASVSIGAYAAVLMKPLSVEAERVAVSNLENRLTVQGTILPIKETVINALSGGEVINLPFQAGSPVKAGDILMETKAASQVDLDLQKEQYRLQLAAARQEYDRLFGTQGSAKAAMTAAQKEYDLAQQNYSNAQSLFDAGGYVSQAELSQLETARELARQRLLQAKEDNSELSRAFYQSKIDSAEKQLTTLETAVSPGTVTAPYDGVVWELYARVGAYMVPNQPVARIYEPDSMKIQVSMLSEDALLIRPAQTALVQYFDGSGEEAGVTFVSQVATKELSSIGLEENRCAVELQPQSLPENAGAGQQADVTFTAVTAKNVLTVPSSAIAAGEKNGFVYVVNKGKTEQRDVESGRKSGGRVEILSGISEGDIVISDPYNAKVKNGSRVDVVLKER